MIRGSFGGSLADLPPRLPLVSHSDDCVKGWKFLFDVRMYIKFLIGALGYAMVSVTDCPYRTDKTKVKIE